jgi:hypothetical protein
VKLRRPRQSYRKDLDQANRKLIGKRYLIGAKHILWDQMIAKVSQVGKHFTVLQDEESLACQVQQSIDKIWTELGDKPLVVDNLIKFLNTISWDELKTLGVNDITFIYNGCHQSTYKEAIGPKCSNFVQ